MNKEINEFLANQAGDKLADYLANVYPGHEDLEDLANEEKAHLAELMGFIPAGLHRFTAESSHEIGYKWEIECPETITKDEIESLIEALVDYTSEPSQEDYIEMLEDDLWGDYDHLEEDKIDEYMKVVFKFHRFYGEKFTQSVTIVK